MTAAIRLLQVLILLGLLTGLPACTLSSGPEVRLEGRTTHDGTLYSIFHPHGLAIRVVTQRPAKDSRAYQLSVAAAYTNLETDRPLDLLVCNGSVLQEKPTVGYLDGVLTIIGDSLAITRIAKGETPPRAQLENARRRQGTVLLQELLVYQGKNLRGAGGSVFQRRALVEFADHRFAVVESVADDLTMMQFGADLVELGALNALYLDMGDWDEGWYKAGSTVAVLGNRRTETARQSNWLVFARPAGAP